MFLDENGEKISKTKGNGVTIDEWLTYAPRGEPRFLHLPRAQEGQEPALAVIPRAVDEYCQFLAAYPGQAMEQKLGNPVHHVHAGQVPPARCRSASRCCSISSPASADDKDTVWGFVQRYAPGTAPESHPELDGLIDFAVDYVRDFIAPDSLQHRAPDRDGGGGAARSRRRLAALPDDADAEAIQTEVYEVGKRTRSRACATGSRRSTKPCSAPARARAWAASSRSTGSPTAAS